MSLNALSLRPLITLIDDIEKRIIIPIAKNIEDSLNTVSEGVDANEERVRKIKAPVMSVALI
jgi:hypothetical protein